MFKSKIFLKAMLVVSSVIVICTLTISIFVIPKNVSKDLENFRQNSLQKYKYKSKEAGELL